MHAVLFRIMRRIILHMVLFEDPASETQFHTEDHYHSIFLAESVLACAEGD